MSVTEFSRPAVTVRLQARRCASALLAKELSPRISQAPGRHRSVPVMVDTASPDLAAADLLAGFALGAPLQNPKASPVGQLALGGGNAARGKGAQVGGAQPGSGCGNADMGGPAGSAPPFADAAAAVQQAMVMVQREQVNFAFRDGLGKRGRKNKEAELERLERKRAHTEAMPLIVPMVQTPSERMLPGASMEDPQMRQEIRHLPYMPQPSIQLLPQVAMPRLPHAPKSPQPDPTPAFHELREETTHTLCASRSQMQHVPPFQAAAYKHPTSVGGQWESTIAGPLPPAHIDRATALEEAQRMAAASAAMQTPIQPFFNQTAEAAFPAMCDTMPLPAANPPGAPALVAFPNGGGVLERGLRRHLKAQGPARPRARRVAPASPPKIVGDGPIGNLCSAAFAADSSSYAIGCARASQATHRNVLAE